MSFKKKYYRYMANQEQSVVTPLTVFHFRSRVLPEQR